MCKTCVTPTAQNPLDNIRNKRGSTQPKDFLTKLKEVKKISNFIGVKFANLAKDSTGKMSEVFEKASTKIHLCSTYGAFREVSPGQIHKVGQALCKNKFCPVCQSVLSWKRREKAAEFFEENQEEMTDYNFFHLVLTLRHNENHRNYNYVEEILKNFKDLRGTNSKKKDYQKWKIFVEGGYYSVEIKQGKDSPHIHIHSIIMTKKDVKSPDLSFIQKNWKTITGDSDQIKVEPIFFLQEKYEEGAVKYERKDGSTAWKINYNPEIHGIEHLKNAFMESLKYTIKTDDILGDMKGKVDDKQKELLYSLLSKRHRLYSRFGCLTNNKKNREKFEGLAKLALNFKDLENVNVTDKSLIDVETGEQKEAHETNIFVTKFSNVKVKKKTEEYTLYDFLDDGKISHFHGYDVKGVQGKLSRTLKKKKE